MRSTSFLKEKTYFNFVQNITKMINNNKKIIDLSIDKMEKAWTTGFVEALK